MAVAEMGVKHAIKPTSLWHPNAGSIADSDGEWLSPGASAAYGYGHSSQNCIRTTGVKIAFWCGGKDLKRKDYLQSLLLLL